MYSTVRGIRHGWVSEGEHSVDPGVHELELN